ncbi:hypothetical protein F543_1830 [Bibersteinia trehalosi USDA-ARS-USMARC-189]|uniref:Uncharacterized protein n=2 Tax=Bibersteinia trehalosi TaxID=47735 RepID=W0RDA5_BIBTR|nr:hypothetical protein [Bibersteinia trehalosi]AHG83047.1 hypothetical protein F543_1830 [Bibersteinia trehalosi USDA-ARS-USMARC-189]AHG87368.1 hypothetical protein F544_21400 [Bibersteinia trehalosi USDA-ARS-USMARC-190]
MLWVSNNDYETVLDSIGDCFVVCTIMRKQLKMEKLFSTEHFDNNHFNCGVATQLVQANIDLGNVASELSRGCDLSRLEDSLSGFENQLVLIAKFYKTDLHLALVYAWNHIKDRKGKMIDACLLKRRIYNAYINSIFARTNFRLLDTKSDKSHKRFLTDPAPCRVYF